MSAELSTEAPSLPRAFGRYVLFDHIGRGGMADIFLARARTGLGGARLVVLKQVLPHLSADARFGEMLVSEAKLAAQLNHANVVQVIDLGREDERLFIAMEYVEGFDLNQLLKNLSRARIPLPAEFAILIVRELLRGLDYAHRARNAEGERLGLVHRDVSPSNVLVSFEGEVKICDFGIARALRLPRAEGEPAQGGQVVGKAAYMSPEHARGEEIDARADVFAAGILLWELCAGRRLYRGTEEEMLAQAKAGQVPPLPDRGLPLADRLTRVLIRMTEPNRRYRYATAQEALDELEAWASEVELMASPLRFGRFLEGHFSESILTIRRQREEAAQKLTGSGQSDIPAALPAAQEAPLPTPPAVAAKAERNTPSRAVEPPPQSSSKTRSRPSTATPSDSFSVAEALAQDERFDEVTGSLSGAQMMALESGEHRLEAARVARRARVTSKAPPPPSRASSMGFYVRLALAALVVGALSFGLVRLLAHG